MTRRPRAGTEGRCRSRSPAPGHGQHRFNSSGKGEGATRCPLTHPLARSLARGRVPPPPPELPGRTSEPRPVSQLRSRPDLRGGGRGYESRRGRRRPSALVPLRTGGGEGAAQLPGRDPRAPGARRGGRGATPAAAAERLPLLPDGSGDSFPSLSPPSGSRSAGVSLSLFLFPCPRFASPPLPSISLCFPLAHYRQVRSCEVQPPSPASFASVAYTRAALASPEGHGAGKDRGQARRREVSRAKGWGGEDWDEGVKPVNGGAGSGLRSDTSRQPMRMLQSPRLSQPLHPALTHSHPTLDWGGGGCEAGGVFTASERRPLPERRSGGSEARRLCTS
jgi:hypothetical protein